MLAFDVKRAIEVFTPADKLPGIKLEFQQKVYQYLLVGRNMGAAAKRKATGVGKFLYNHFFAEWFPANNNNGGFR